jgi:hypothetical protein
MYRCYWWPLRPPPKDGEEGEGEYQMGLNTNNVNPEQLRFVDRKFEYSMLRTPLKETGEKHRDDLADY